MIPEPLVQEFGCRLSVGMVLYKLFVCCFIGCDFLQQFQLQREGFLMKGENCTYLWVEGQMSKMGCRDHSGCGFSSTYHDMISLMGW